MHRQVRAHTRTINTTIRMKAGEVPVWITTAKLQAPDRPITLSNIPISKLCRSSHLTGVWHTTNILSPNNVVPALNLTQALHRSPTEQSPLPSHTIPTM